MTTSDGESRDDERQQENIVTIKMVENETGIDPFSTQHDTQIQLTTNESCVVNKSFEDFSNFSSDQISDCGDDNDYECDSQEHSPPDEEDYEQSEEIDNYESSEDGEYIVGLKRSRKRVQTIKKSKTSIKRTMSSVVGRSHKPINFKKKKKPTMYGGMDYGDTTTEEESITEEEFNQDDLLYKYTPDDDDDDGDNINDSIDNTVNNTSTKLDLNKLGISNKYVSKLDLPSNSLTIDKVLNYRFRLDSLVGKKLYQLPISCGSIEELDHLCADISDNKECASSTYELINANSNDDDINKSIKNIEELAIIDSTKRSMQFLIKWKHKSYLHCTWESQNSLVEQQITNIKKLQNFCQENDIDPCCSEDPICLMDECSQSLFSDKNQAIANILEEFTKLDCILAISPNMLSEENTTFDSNIDYNHDEIVAEGVEVLCLWKDLPYSDATWEEASLIDQLFTNAIRNYFTNKSKMYYQLDLRRMGNIKFYKVNSTPDFIAHCNCSQETEFLIHPSSEDQKNNFDTIDNLVHEDNIKNEDINIASELAPLECSQPHSTCNILRDYQLEGVNWLTSSFCRKKSIILADEMGLGKTVQVISFISTLLHTYHINGPFLIVVPLSTIESWKTHFNKWAPDLTVLGYTGNAESRRIMRRYTVFDSDYDVESIERKKYPLDNFNDQVESQNTEEFNIYNVQLKFNVFVTTYEMIIKDKEFIGQFDWVSLIVDEAHRLKNEESSLYMTLQSFYTSHRLLMTGTPLQNNLRELWCILHFIIPDRYQTWEDFEMNFSQVDPMSGYMKLQKEISPYILRRMKKDVEKSLPPKIEQILRVEMTKKQKDLYKCILTKNYTQLSKELKCNVTGFLNVMMELKKCCNHTSLITHLNLQDCTLQDILRGSGKMILLDKLLDRFKQDGSRVLIFSQMIMILDILSNYLTKKGYSFQRLDGSVSEAKRKQAMNEFNAKGSENFCFLLSTRAGGLGINLVSADIVIIFDSDWNPQNDLQAQARAHRIGQTKTVKIYRLVTKSSVDETIVERAKKKMVLDHLVIQTMSGISGSLLMNSQKSSSMTSNFNKKDLSSIIKFGAVELFKEDNDDNDDDELQKLDLDKILSLAEEHEQEGQSCNNDLGVGVDLLSSFKVANFKTSDFGLDDDDESDSLGSDNERVWDDIIPEAERKRITEEEETKRVAQLYLPPRRRTNVPMIDPYDKSNPRNLLSKNLRKNYNRRTVRSIGIPASDESSNNDIYNNTSSDERKKSAIRKKGKLAQFINDFDGLNPQDIKKFVASYKKFPSAWDRCEIVATDATLSNKPIKQIQQLAKWLHYILPKANPKSGTSKSNRSNKLTINQVQINSAELYEWEQIATSLTQHIRNFIVRQKPEYSKLKLRAFTLESFRGLFSSFTTYFKQFKFPEFSFPGIVWKLKHDSELLVGVFFIGLGNWKIMFEEGLLNNLRDSEISLSVISKKLKNRFKTLMNVLDSSECHHSAEDIFSDSDKDHELKNEINCKSKSKKNDDTTTKRKNKKTTKAIKATKSGRHQILIPSKVMDSKIPNDNVKNVRKRKSNLITQYMESNSKKDSNTSYIKEMDKISEMTLTDKMVDVCGGVLKLVKNDISKLETLFKGMIYEEVTNSSDFKNYMINIGDRIDSSTGKCILNKHVKIFKTAYLMKSALWNFVSRFTNATPIQLYNFYYNNMSN